MLPIVERILARLADGLETSERALTAIEVITSTLQEETELPAVRTAVETTNRESAQAAKLVVLLRRGVEAKHLRARREGETVIISYNATDGDRKFAVHGTQENDRSSWRQHTA